MEVGPADPGGCDAHGDLWVGSSKGQIFRISGDTLINESVRVQGWTNSIRAIHITADNTLWIGYAVRGLGRWKDNHGTWHYKDGNVVNKAKINPADVQSAAAQWIHPGQKGPTLTSRL